MRKIDVVSFIFASKLIKDFIPMLKSEPQITLQDWTWHDFKRTYITIANFHSKEIGYYSYKFNKLVLTTDLKIPDDLLLFIRDELYKNLGKKARLVITH